MMQRFIKTFLIALLGLMGTAYADDPVVVTLPVPSPEVCVKLDPTLLRVDPTQIPLFVVIYDWLWRSGVQVDHVGLFSLVGDQFCVKEATPDPSAFLTEDQINKHFDTMLAERATFTATEAAKNAALEQELTNDLCDGSLDELTMRIDQTVNAATDATAVKDTLSDAVKKVARCLKARSDLRQ
jgi:hypothetical protein